MKSRDGFDKRVRAINKRFDEKKVRTTMGGVCGRRDSNMLKQFLKSRYYEITFCHFFCEGGEKIGKQKWYVRKKTDGPASSMRSEKRGEREREPDLGSIKLSGE